MQYDNRNFGELDGLLQIIKWSLYVPFYIHICIRLNGWIDSSS